MGDIGDFLRQNGLKLDGVDRVRLTRGVVGKSSYVAVAALVVLLVLAFRAPVGLIMVITFAALFLFVIYFLGILWFANKNPGVALLEGAELIKWRQMDMGMKGVVILPEQPNTTPPPLLAEPKS